MKPWPSICSARMWSSKHRYMPRYTEYVSPPSSDTAAKRVKEYVYDICVFCGDIKCPELFGIEKEIPHDTFDLRSDNTKEN